MNRSDKVTVLTRSGAKLADDAGTLSKDAIKLLEDLYAQARDSAKGYRESAEAASSGAMKARLFGLARRRNAMAGQLEIAMRSLGIETGHDGSIGATLHRYFEDLKNKLETEDTRGAITSIEKALRETLPDAVHGFLERQQRQVRGAMERFSGDIASGDRLAAIRQKAVQYRKPALFTLAAVAVGALATVLIIQQRRNGTVTRSLAGARIALDRALAQLPSASQVRRSIEGIHMPAVRMPDIRMPDVHMPDVKMPHFSMPSMSDVKSFLKRR